MDPCVYNINGLVQDCSNSIANAMELLQACTKPSKRGHGRFAHSYVQSGSNSSVSCNNPCVFYWNISYPATFTHYFISMDMLGYSHVGYYVFLLNSYPLDNMSTISQIFFVFWFEFHWRLLLGVQWTKSQLWFRWWLGADLATSHHPNQCWPKSLTHICGTKERWFKCINIS